jgi:hypothetical protein
MAATGREKITIGMLGAALGLIGAIAGGTLAATGYVDSAIDKKIAPIQARQVNTDRWLVEAVSALCQAQPGAHCPSAAGLIEATSER